MNNTISEEYRVQNRQLHEQRTDYGTSGAKYADMVSGIAASLGVQDILDYGCGKQTLAQALPHLNVVGYDPAIEGFDSPPEPCDFVVCTDVLEHIEPEYLDNVLADLARVTQKQIFLEVACRKAKKHLPDGRNAHLIVETPNWWISKLMEVFDVQNISVYGVAGENGEEIYSRGQFVASMSRKQSGGNYGNH